MSEQTTTVRTDELRPGDRVWHPFDFACFTVAHPPEQVALDFEGERGLRVTGTDDRGETVHVDVAPAYKWHRGPQVAAPTTHDPLVLNTKNGVCWTRRAVTRGGIALYAPESVKTCPDFVMATIDELAERGIVGSAYVLPMPVAPERPLLSVRTRELVEMEADRNRWKAEAGELRARVAELEAEREKLVRWHGEDGKTINRLVARVERRQAELIALRNDALSVRGSLAPADGPRAVPFELGETLAPAVDWLIARVAELEAPDFFQPGHAYTHQPGPDTIGGPRVRFYCETVTTDRTTGQPVARGWGGRRYGDRWTSVQQARGLEDWQSGAWTDTTTGGDR